MTVVNVWDKHNGDTLVKGTTALVLTHCWCGLPVGVPEPLYRYAKRHAEQSIYCPLGHSFIFGDTTDAENERLRDERARLRAQLDQEHETALGYKRAASRARNQRDQLRERVAAGVCPCCHRTFKQLRRHMTAKHPDYPKAAVE